MEVEPHEEIQEQENNDNNNHENFTITWVEKNERHKFPELQPKNEQEPAIKKQVSFAIPPKQEEQKEDNVEKINVDPELAKFIEANGKELNLVGCPKCNFVFEKIPLHAQLNRQPTRIQGADGKLLPLEALKHRSENRFRCRKCFTEFCAECKESPYHLGMNCQQFKDSKDARHCRFCKTVIPSMKKLDPPPDNVDNCAQCHYIIPKRKPRRRGYVERQMMMCDGCPNTYCNYCAGFNDPNDPKIFTEDDWFCPACKRDCCREVECVNKYNTSCKVALPCGHNCISYQGYCFDCIEPKCLEARKKEKGTQETQCIDDLCNICWVEELGAAPCLKLNCGHIFHFSCLQNRITSKADGPALNFNHLQCPLCREVIGHACLQWQIDQEKAMKARVEVLGLAMLKEEGLDKSEIITDEKSEWHNKPQEYAMKIYTFFKCYSCGAPYFGGRRDCQANIEEPKEYKPQDYVCESCVLANCPKHGKVSMEWKCRYCCSVAYYFCFGTTHFCTPCHTWPRVNELINWTNTGAALPAPLSGCSQCLEDDLTKQAEEEEQKQKDEQKNNENNKDDQNKENNEMKADIENNEKKVDNEDNEMKADIENNEKKAENENNEKQVDNEDNEDNEIQNEDAKQRRKRKQAPKKGAEKPPKEPKKKVEPAKKEKKKPEPKKKPEKKEVKPKKQRKK